MGFLDRFRSGAASSVAKPSAAFFKNERLPILQGWRPRLREGQHDVAQAWEVSAARAVEQIQNQGFIKGAVEVAAGSAVGSGLRMACRPDPDVLGWTEDECNEWARLVETRFQAWADNPLECDAAGQMTFGQMQQAAFASYMAYGEIFGLMPMLKRRGVTSMTKIALLPPSRVVNYTAPHEGWVQGVQVDGWGLPLAYKIRRPQQMFNWEDITIRARDRDGRPNAFLIKDPAIATTRGISPLASVLKVTRQIEQYADATLTTAMIQTIFAAVLKSNIQGMPAFDGLLTNADTNEIDIAALSQAKSEWYDGANIDLSQHGRIAQLFPTDELEFKEAKTPGAQFDHFMGWMLREVTLGAGVTYESGTNDYRGATYSSVRMAGAVEWLTVMRRRGNLIVPFSRMGFNAWLEEEVGTGRIPFNGGYQKFLEQRAAGIKTSWTGPARPQADDFKTARAYQVRKEMGSTTLAEISEEYGRDWDDDMRQRARENKLASDLKLPLPWAPVDVLETEKGQDLALQEPANAPDERKDGKRPDPKRTQRRKGAGRNPPEREPSDARSKDELEAEFSSELGDDLNAQLEKGLTEGDS